MVKNEDILFHLKNEKEPSIAAEKLVDIAKRKALKEKTGFDVDVAIRNMEAEKAEDNGIEENKITPAPTTAAATGRRATTNYKVVSKTEEAKAE